MSSSNSPGTMLPMRREQAGSVTFCRYVKARRRRWISWNALRRLFNPFLLIPRFSFTVLLVAGWRPPLARLIGLCRVRPQPKRIEEAGYQDWETRARIIVLGEFAEHRNRE